MFVLHCILGNIVAYVKAELVSFSDNLNRGMFVPNRDGQAAYIRRTELSIRPMTQRSSAHETPTKRRRKGGARKHGGHDDEAVGSFVPDDVPFSVRAAVYSADERALGRVDGLTAVRRLPEGRDMMLLDSSGHFLGYEKVRKPVEGVAGWQARCSLAARRLPCWWLVRDAANR